MLFYRASLSLSRQTLNFAAGIIRRHRTSTGSLRRKLNPGQLPSRQEPSVSCQRAGGYLMISHDAR
jgi:hypothetical protein